MIKPLKIAKFAADILDGKKAVAPEIYNVSRFTIVAEYFVVATATSDTHRRTLIDAVKKGLVCEGISAIRTEGMNSGGWTVADFGGVILHIMSPAVRAEVGLEKLYAGARKIVGSKKNVEKNFKRKDSSKTRR